MINKLVIAVLAMSFVACNSSQQKSTGENEQDNLELYRPAYHFSPQDGWMNDPNGLVFVDGEYHLFFQHNPDSTIWGPMHWGHAVSKDLFHWEEQPIALFPDSLGTIFSGSVVVDKDNTAGFGANALIAIYTSHSHEIEEQKTGLHETQSIAYSLDKGKTWEKYEGNPVLPNPGIWDFRDPKVMWHTESKQWIMTLATKQTITFYGSQNLKKWERLSEFGEGTGAHGGVWECPDLLRFATSEGEKWVLLVSINPGGPNTGSATQYFVGDFDGKTFSSVQQDIRWMDYGPDNYAGVTFSNTEGRHILMGWMSNWEYANVVPASTWRSGNTVARDLTLTKVNDKWILASQPVTELKNVASAQQIDEGKLKTDSVKTGSQFRLSFETQKIEDFEFILSNGKGNKLAFGYDKAKNEYYLDRSVAYNVEFSDKFVKRAVAPRVSKSPEANYTILVDRNSIEVFADNGSTNLTGLFFVEDLFDKLHLDAQMAIKEITFEKIKQTVNR